MFYYISTLAIGFKKQKIEISKFLDFILYFLMDASKASYSDFLGNWIWIISSYKYSLI